MSIPRSLIRKMAADNAVYMQGYALYNTTFSHKIEPTVFTDLFHITAVFENKKVKTELEIDNANEMIEKTVCNCADFLSNGHICKHIVALLLKIENDFFSEDFARNRIPLQNKPETDSFCLALLKERAAVIQARALQRASFEKALVVPQITFLNGRVHIGLKVGCKRAYLVRDLEVFYHQLQNKEVADCGNAKQFLYTPENFFNEAFIRFFMAYYPLCRETDNKKNLCLTPEALDRLIALYSGHKLTTVSSTLTLSDDLPAFTLFIKPSAAFYRLNLDRHNFEIYKGQAQIYIKENDVLYCCGAAFSDACCGLLERFCGTGTSPLILRSDMSTFYSLLIKPAARFMHIESADQSFVPGALKAKIFLDIAGKNLVARTEFHYDNVFYYAFSPERDLQTMWDIEEEAAIETLVKTYFPHAGKAPGTAVVAADDDSLFQLVYEGIPALSKHAVLYISAELKNIRIKTMPTPSVTVRAESGLLKLDILADKISPAVLAAALSAYQQKKKYIRLKDGSFLLADTESMHKFSHVADSLGLSSADVKKQALTLPAYRAFYLDSLTEIPVIKDKSFVKLANAFAEMETAEYRLPNALNNVLRDYQKFGFNWLSILTQHGFGGILADDMGLGKTVQILSLLLAEKEKNGSVKALVVCPASLVLNWENEIRRFTPTLRARCIFGTATERAALIAQATNFDVLITSYDFLKRDIQQYQALTFDFQIIDEAQYIKNHHTQNARSVKAIRSKIRFALTGTPIENNIAELWSIFDYLMPGYLFRYARFRQKFELPIMRDENKTALQELKKITAPFILRRLKRDVLKELPKKTETVLYTNLAPEQHKLYHAHLASMQKELSQYFEKTDVAQNKITVLAMLMRLRQLCCDPALLYEHYHEESAKFDLCMNLVETSIASGHKMLIFSQFTSMLSLLAKRLKQKQIPYFLIEGATKKEDRLAQVSAFNQDSTPVFLISLKAGGTGLNLTGADVVIHYDPWWNLSVQNQATDRTHRIGQKNSVTVYKLITKNSVEEKILALAEKKQSLAENILPDENSFLKGMTKEQILDLFQP